MSFSAKDIKYFEHSRGIAWSVKILKDGKVVGSCENDGRGGANDYDFSSPEIRDEFEQTAKEKYPHARDANHDLIEELIKPLEKKHLKKMAVSEKLRKVASKIKKAENESYMSQSYLKNMQQMVSDLLTIVNPEADMEDWVDAKITKAHESLADVHNYLRNHGQSTEE